MQAVGLVPSQILAEQTFCAFPCEQAWRVPPGPELTGMPEIVTHMPTELAVLHAWHCPEHAVLQQTPSTQLP